MVAMGRILGRGDDGVYVQGDDTPTQLTPPGTRVRVQQFRSCSLRAASSRRRGTTYESKFRGCCLTRCGCSHALLRPNNRSQMAASHGVVDATGAVTDFWTFPRCNPTGGLMSQREISCVTHSSTSATAGRLTVSRF